MSGGIIPFPGRRGSDGRDGSGPEGPDLTARVARLGEANVRIEAALGRIESTSQKLIDGQHRLELEAAEVKGRIGAVEGRLTGIEGRFPFLPTSIQLIGFILSIFVLLGLFRFLEPRLAPSPPAVTAPR